MTENTIENQLTWKDLATIKTALLDSLAQLNCITGYQQYKNDAKYREHIDGEIEDVLRSLQRVNSMLEKERARVWAH